MTGTGERESAGVERQRSLALAELLPGPGRAGASDALRSVLDLGPASRENLTFFARRGARLTVADLYREFGRERRSTELFARLLRYRPGERFDLVLAWDILNYLKLEELGALVEALSAHLRSGTLVHAFIVTGPDMASEPVCYRIENGTSLLRASPRGRRVGAPRYVEPALLRSMRGLTVEHRFQLRNGLSEYLFTYRPRQRTELSVDAPAFRETSAHARSERVIEWTPVPSR